MRLFGKKSAKKIEKNVAVTCAFCQHAILREDAVVVTTHNKYQGRWNTHELYYSCDCAPAYTDIVYTIVKYRSVAQYYTKAHRGLPGFYVEVKEDA